MGAAQVIEWTDAGRPGVDRRAAPDRHSHRRAADPRSGGHGYENRRSGRRRRARQPGAVRADRLARAHGAPVRRARRPEAPRAVPHAGRAPERDARTAALAGHQRRPQHARGDRGVATQPAQHGHERAPRQQRRRCLGPVQPFHPAVRPGGACGAAEQRSGGHASGRAGRADPAGAQAPAVAGRTAPAARGGRGVRVDPGRGPAAAATRPRHQRARPGHLHQLDRRYRSA